MIQTVKQTLKWILSILSKKRILFLFLLALLFRKRKQITTRKSITINSNVLFWNPSSNPLLPNIAFKESTLVFIQLLIKLKWTITIINIVKSDKEQEHILKLLTTIRGLQMDRILFCEQPESIVSMVRHVEPQVHMDSNVQMIKKISPFVHCYLVKERALEKRLPRTGSTDFEELPNVTRINSLSDCTFLEQ